MEERLFHHLLKNEPTAIELTKEEYEIRMGIRPTREESQESEDVTSAVGQDTDTTPEAPIPVDYGTKKDLIKILKKRGFGAGELNRKNKQQLIEML